MNKRIDYLDFIKTIVIFIVIGTHVPIFEYNFIETKTISSYIQYLFKVFSNVVTLFFVVNGYLLFSKKELDIKKHYKKTAKLLLLIFIWAIILIVVNLIFDNTHIDRHIIIDLFLNIGSGLYVHELWFLIDLFAIYLIFPLLWVSYKNRKDVFCGIVVVLLFYGIGMKIFEYASYMMPTIEKNTLVIRLYNMLNNTNIFGLKANSLFYFCLGGLIFEYIDELENRRKMLFILSIISIILASLFGILISNFIGYTFDAGYLDSTVFYIPIILYVFSYVNEEKKQNTFTKLTKIIGNNTLGIYLTHSFFIRVVRLFVPQTNLLFRIAIQFISLFGSLILTIILKKIPIINKLFDLK